MVRRNQAEEVRKKLLSEGVIDKTRKLIIKNGFVEIPVKSSFSDNRFTIIEQETPEFYTSRKTLKDVLDIPEKELLPKGWQILGDIIIVSIHKKLEKYKTEIGEALLSLHPECRSVLLDRGVKGTFRLPQREVIAGDSNTETIHRENACVFKLNAAKIMYSKGNLAERKRMSELGKGETVVDMFAGIGYFSIPMAVHSKPERIIAIEINPVAFEYLKENIKLNKVEHIIEPICGDCSEVTPAGIADRVIMGYLNAYEFLEHGIHALKHNGVLHYHEAVPEAVMHRPVERVVEEAKRQGRKAEITGMRRIKKYAPGVWHVVVDAIIR